MRSQRSEVPRSGEWMASLQIIMCCTHMRLNVKSKRREGMGGYFHSSVGGSASFCIFYPWGLSRDYPLPVNFKQLSVPF